jgi:hypothetical protein
MCMTFNIFLINYKSNLVDMAIGICRHMRMYHLISCPDDGVPIHHHLFDLSHEKK